jgi:hypothetical protein
MTQIETLALKPGDIVGYRNHYGDKVQSATVIRNDQPVRHDDTGLLVVQIDKDTVNWVPENFRLGIPQLSDASTIGLVDVPWE